MKLKGLVIFLVGALSCVSFAQVGDVHRGRVLVFEPNDMNVRASVKGEMGVFALADGTKTAAGGEGMYGEPYVDIFVDITRRLKLGEIGVSLNFIEPDTAMVSYEDERENRIHNRGFFIGPQWRTTKLFWRYTNEGNLFEMDAGRDMFLGFAPLFGRYQGSMPLILRNSLYWDNGFSVRYEQYKNELKLFGFRVCVLDGEGWRGLEDEWKQNSYPSFGVQADISPLNLLAGEEFIDWFGDLRFLASWTNAEGGSSPGSKEQLGHFLYGVRYFRELFGLGFESRLLAGTITRGSNDTERYEETSGWAWENKLSGIELGESTMDPYFALSDANHDSGDPAWLWRTADTTFEKQWKVGLEINDFLGVDDLSFVGEYFQKSMDGQGDWRALKDSGVWLGFVYGF